MTNDTNDRFEPNAGPHLSRRLAVSGLLLAGGLSLSSKRAVAAGGGATYCASYSDLVNAIAAIGSTGGLVLCQPGAVITFGSSPLLIANKSYLTLDLTGAQLQATANMNDTQLYMEALIYLQNCTNCHVTGNALINGNGFANSAVGLAQCTNCDVEQLIATGCNNGFGQFFSVGSTRSAFRFCQALNAQGTTRGFWLGNAQPGWGETDLEVVGCKAISNPATGIVVQANGAKVIGNTSTDNKGAGIASSSTSGGTLGSFNAILGNDCRRNAFWGWQSDANAPLSSTTVSGNLFDSNTTGAALLNECSTIMYGGNIDNGLVVVTNCSGGKIQLGPGATLQDGGGNTDVSFS